MIAIMGAISKENLIFGGGALAILGLWIATGCACLTPPSWALWGGLIGGVVIALALLWAAHQVMQDTGGLMGCLLGYGLAIVLIASSASFYTSSIGQTWASPEERSEIQRLPVKNGVVLLEGDIDFATFDAVQQVLAEGLDIRVLALSSNGGAVHAARGIARLVRENQWDTIAMGGCYSACTLVFIAGSKRRLSPQGALGFHSYAALFDTTTGKVTLGSPKEEQDQDRIAFERAGVSPAFLDKMFDAPHSGLWQPEPSELRASGVVTD